MDVRNVQISIFDAFGFVFPGVLILFSAIILAENDSVIHLKDAIEPFKALNTSLFIAGTFIAYVIGFLVNTFGYKLYKKVGSLLWKMPDDIKLGREQARYAVLVREFSPRNLAHLEKWNALKAMSHNFSVSFLVLFIVCVIKTFSHLTTSGLEWICLGLASVYFAYTLLHRAYFYHRYYYEDLRHTVEALYLEEKAKNEAESRQRYRESYD